MFKKYLIAATMLATGMATALAPVALATDYAAPTEVGLSGEGLEKLKQHIAAYVASGRLVGATTLVAKKGKIAHFETYGQINKEAGTEMSKDAVFRIYSMTKPITGVGLMMLWEEGKFKLDDPVSKYLPEFANQRVFAGANEDGSLRTVPVEREMTVRDLLTHTSGLTYGVFGNTPVDQLYIKAGVFNPELTLAEQTKILGGLPLLYQPGQAWVYSLSVDVQGRLIEVLSDQSLGEFFEQRIFAPLGMTDTGFFVRPDQLDRFVEIYAPSEEEKQLVAYRGDFFGDFTVKPKSESGGGGLVSTTLDYWKFAQMVANGGELDGVRLLKADTVAMMRRDHLPENLNGIAGGKQGLGFGLGFAVVHDVEKQGGKTNVGEYFWGGMANTIFWIDPSEEMVAIFMTNILPSGIYPLRNELRDQIYGAVDAE